ncbi:MAG: acyl-CoA thioesterase/bile acid-CoA:amino acid N-acyltransferase family protein [Parvularcula sp.]|jgi:dienelactone hydrolase|nr:acyl-CoA thioesterase/bile acid-CoA:amino acid N-acyltransferase family protein [Parvularcula sp.]
MIGKGTLFAKRVFASAILLSSAAAAANTVSIPAIDAPPDLLWADMPQVTVTGAVPSGQVTITATMIDKAGTTWSSRGTYYADANGQVSVGSTASNKGTYTGVDPRGLIWSMLPTSPENLSSCIVVACMPSGSPGLPYLPVMEGVTITYRADVEVSPASDRVKTVSASTTAYFAAPGVSREQIIQGELRGVYFSPEGAAPDGAVLVVSGSGGGASESTAALLASHGIAAFAIAYFNYEGRPKDLADIPLEIFRDGIDWLKARAGVERVGLMGGSRGGEAVLLVASMWPEKTGAVVSIVPSNVAWPGCCGPEAAVRPSWTFKGMAVPTTPYAFEEGQGFDTQTDVAEWRRFFLPGMISEGDGRIRVEKIDAPIMFVTGEADALWPSSIAAALMTRRLDRESYPHRVQHLNYPGAGHLAGAPLPVTSMANELVHPVTKAPISFGGTPALNAAAGIGSFAQIVAFLKSTLDQDR